jgi:hypothetical protein
MSSSPRLRLPRRRADDARSRRVAGVLAVVERFVYDLGLLSAGDSVDLESYVDGPAAERLRHALRPAAGAEVSTRPDYGEYAQVRIEGDLLDPDGPVLTVVELDDRSTRVDANGNAVLRLRRRLRLLLVLDPASFRVLDHRLEIA